MAENDDLLEGLEERLQSHAKAFDSLLALTPAREYYGSHIADGLDPSEQWNRKKQTKEQKRAAKKAKLDPANQKSALDVMKEREHKRKRELGLVEAGEAPADAAEADESAPVSKRQKQDADPEAERAAKADKRREARQRKQERKAKTKAKAEAKKARKQEASAAPSEKKAAKDDDEEEWESDEADEAQPAGNSRDVEKMDLSGLVDEESAPSSPAQSPAFDVATNHSETSSSSSIVPLPFADTKTAKKTAQKPLPKFQGSLGLQTKVATSKADLVSGTESPKLKLPDIDQAELQARLRKRIEELRANRKADGADGQPARSRQELLDQRRKKEEQRKAHKKEARRQAKEEEARKREEQLRGSGSPLSLDPFSSARASPRPDTNNFSFSRVAFDDGTAADAALSTLTDAKKRKGPSDTRTALLAAEKKAARLAALDPATRADIAEKDRWLAAKKHAHGERVRDDTSLLKKALKRKEKLKLKSANQWNERQDAVVKGKEMKQKRREANLQKRREEKGGKGKKKAGSGEAKGKKKGRPGFEGRFKA